MTFHRVAVVLVLLSALPSPAQTWPKVTVRIFTLHPPAQISIAPDGNAANWRACQACSPHPLATEIKLSSKTERMTVTGNPKAFSSLFVEGPVLIRTDDNRSLHSKFPLQLRSHAGRIVATLTLPMETYVAVVLAGETRADDPDEFLKAMAVVVRTYATRFRGRHKSEAFDFCDTTHCQFLRLDAVDPRLQNAAEATESELLWYHGRPASTYYHEDCGGMTTSGDELWSGVSEPYLTRHADPYCLRNSRAEWQATIPRDDLQSALQQSGIHVPRTWTSIQVASRTPSLRARTLHFNNDSAGDLSASTLRFAVGRALGWNLLRSDWYQISMRGAEVVFTGKGYGHGVGLCQAGAAEMARQGKTHRDILDFYYPGTALGISAQGIPWKIFHGERLDALATASDDVTEIVSVAERAMRQAEANSGWNFDFHPTIKLYPTIAMYRDATGEPGWVAASTRGHTVRLQPVEMLRARGLLESTLRHEFLHQLMESRTRAPLPLWFREGLVAYLERARAPEPPVASNRFANLATVELVLSHHSNAGQMQQAYAWSRTKVHELINQYGEAEVLEWLRRGLPRDVISRVTTVAEDAAQH